MPDDTGRARHVYQVYVYAVCFVTLLILLFTVVSFLFAIVRIAFPGTTARGSFGGFSFFGAFAGAFASGGEDTERDLGIVQLVQSGILGIAAGALFYVHWGWANRLRTREERTERFRPPAAREPRPAREPVTDAAPAPEPKPAPQRKPRTRKPRAPRPAPPPPPPESEGGPL